MSAKSTPRKQRHTALVTNDFSCLDIPSQEDLTWEEHSMAGVCDAEVFKAKTVIEKEIEEEVVSKAALLNDLEYSDISRLLNDPCDDQVNVLEALSKVNEFRDLLAEIKISSSILDQSPNKLLLTDQLHDKLPEEVPMEYGITFVDRQETSNIGLLIESVCVSESMDFQKNDDQYLEDELLAANLGPLLATAVCDEIDLYAELVKSDGQKCNDSSNKELEAFIGELADDETEIMHFENNEEIATTPAAEILIRSVLDEIINSMMNSPKVSVNSIDRCYGDAGPTQCAVDSSESIDATNSVDDPHDNNESSMPSASADVRTDDKLPSSEVSSELRVKCKKPISSHSSSLNSEETKIIPLELRNKLLTQNSEAKRMNALRFRVSETTVLVKKDNPEDDTDTSEDSDSDDLSYSDGEEDLMDEIFVELGMLRYSVELLHTLQKDAMNVERVCEVLDEIQGSNLTVKMLVKYPFLSGTVDACCRLIVGDHYSRAEAMKVRAAANEVQSKMMALFPRINNDEMFMQAFSREVVRHQQATIPDRTLISILDRVCQENLKEFYSADSRSLYSAWDGFFIEFCDPDRELIHVDSKDDSHDASSDNVDEKRGDIKFLTSAVPVKQKDAVRRLRQMCSTDKMPATGERCRASRGKSRCLRGGLPDAVIVKSEVHVLDRNDILGLDGNSEIETHQKRNEKEKPSKKRQTTKMEVKGSSDGLTNAGVVEACLKRQLGKSSVRSSGRSSLRCKDANIQELTIGTGTCPTVQDNLEVRSDDSMTIGVSLLKGKPITKQKTFLKNFEEAESLDMKWDRNLDSPSESNSTKKSAGKRTLSLESLNLSKNKKALAIVKPLQPAEVSEELDMKVPIELIVLKQSCRKRTKSLESLIEAKKNKPAVISATMKPVKPVRAGKEMEPGIPFDNFNGSTVVEQCTRKSAQSLKNVRCCKTIKREQSVRQRTKSKKNEQVKIEVDVDIPSQSIVIKKEVDLEFSSEILNDSTKIRRWSFRQKTKTPESSNTSNSKPVMIAEPLQLVQVKQEVDVDFTSLSTSIKKSHKSARKDETRRSGLRSSNLSKKNEPFNNVKVPEPPQPLQGISEINSSMSKSIDSTMMRRSVSKSSISLGSSNLSARNESISVPEPIKVKNELDWGMSENDTESTVMRRWSVTKSTKSLKSSNHLQRSNLSKKNKPSVVSEPFFPKQVEAEGDLDFTSLSTVIKSETDSTFSNEHNIESTATRRSARKKTCVVTEPFQSILVKKEIDLDVTSESDVRKRSASRNIKSLRSSKLSKENDERFEVTESSQLIQVKSEVDFNITSEHMNGASIIRRSAEQKTKPLQSSKPSINKPSVVTELFHLIQVDNALDSEDISGETVNELAVKRRSSSKRTKSLGSLKLSKENTPFMATESSLPEQVKTDKDLIFRSPSSMIRNEKEFGDMSSDTTNRPSATKRTQSLKSSNHLQRSNLSKKNKPSVVGEPFLPEQVEAEEDLDFTSPSTVIISETDSTFSNEHRRSVRKKTHPLQNSNSSKCTPCVVTEPFQSILVKKEIDLDVTGESAVRKRSSSRNINSLRSSKLSKENEPFEVTESSHLIKVKSEVDLNIRSEHINGASIIRRSAEQKMKPLQSLKPSTSKPSVVAELFHLIQVDNALDSEDISGETVNESAVKRRSGSKRTKSLRSSLLSKENKPFMATESLSSEPGKIDTGLNFPSQSTSRACGTDVDFPSQSTASEGEMSSVIPSENLNDSIIKRQSARIRTTSLETPTTCVQVQTKSSMVTASPLLIQVKREIDLDSHSQSEIVMKNPASIRKNFEPPQNSNCESSADPSEE